MARQTEKLTALKVKQVSAPGYYSDGNGLYLQIAKGGSKSWVLRFKLAGKAHEMGLGGIAAFGLAEARERAKSQRQLLADGINPIAHRNAAILRARADAANMLTFDEAASRYIKTQEAGWRNAKHAQQWRSTLETYASPFVGTMHIAEIETSHVMRVLEPIWATKNETASRVRGRMEAVLDWARVQGYRKGDNPARWRGHLDKLLARPSKVQAATSKHHAALAWQELPSFMVELRKQHGVAARAVELVILTAARTSEVFNARWSEFDLDARVWTIPSERMKANKEHRIPLSDAAIAVLKQLETDSEYVCSGRSDGHLSNMSGLSLLKRMGRADLTVHGFRSSFRDWAGEATAHPREVIEHALSHQLKDKAEAAYARGTLFGKRKALMADWGLFCTTVRTAANILPIRKVS